MTRFQVWLAEHGGSKFGFAREHNLSLDQVAMLATPGARSRKFVTIRSDVLLAIYEATGIRPGDLVDDYLGIPAFSGFEGSSHATQTQAAE